MDLHSCMVTVRMKQHLWLLGACSQLTVNTPITFLLELQINMTFQQLGRRERE